MRVALVGLPGTGKSEYGKALASKEDIKLVDNLPQNLARRMGGVHVGHLSDWRVEMALSAERFERWHRYHDCVMTTTVLDTLVYTLWKAERSPTSHFSIFYLSAYKLVEDSFGYDRLIRFKKGKMEEWEAILDTYYDRVIDALGLEINDTISTEGLG